MTPDVGALFSRQLAAWPLLAKGVTGLAAARTKTVDVNGFPVLVRHIPHRVASTTAAVDPASIARRPCFLCRANMPPEEEGLPFGDFALYANPFPVLSRHLTIVHREHRPQRVADALEPLLELAAALPGSVLVYNGPECGASAPDHLHVQAGARDELPIARDAAGMDEGAIEGYGWKGLLLRGERADVAARFRRALEVLGALTRKQPEPLVNLAAFADGGGRVALVLLPRSRHRPEAFHRGLLTVSPAALDLCGILVTPVERDFERIGAADVESVFREVTLPDGVFDALVAGLGAGS